MVWQFKAILGLRPRSVDMATWTVFLGSHDKGIYVAVPTCHLLCMHLLRFKKVVVAGEGGEGVACVLGLKQRMPMIVQN